MKEKEPFRRSIMHRYYVITSLIILALLVSACSADPASQSPNVVAPESIGHDDPGDTEKEDAFAGIFDVPDPDFNSSYSLIQMYNGDVYYTNYTGIYRMDPATGQKSTVTNQSLTQYFVVQGDSVYYYDYEKESIMRIASSGEGEPVAQTIEGIDVPLLLGSMCKIGNTMFVYVNIYPDVGDYDYAFYAAEIDGKSDTLSFRKVTGWPSPNGMRYFLEPASSSGVNALFDMFVQGIDSEEKIKLTSEMNTNKYIVTNKYIFFLQYTAEDFSKAEVRRMNLDGSDAQTFIDDSVNGDFFFAKYDEEYLYCFMTDYSRDTIEDLLMFNQETGESIEIPIIDFEQFDIAKGFIYGYDRAEKDVVRIQLP